MNVVRCMACGLAPEPNDRNSLARHWDQSPLCETAIHRALLLAEIDLAIASGRAAQKRRASKQGSIFEALGLGES